MKQIFFAHANGFPAGTYTKLFNLLEDNFHVAFVERLGHDERFPVTDGWTHLRDELRHAIETRFSKRIVGVGHSLGGVLHFLVAVEHPELYERLILLDAPIISRLSSHGIRILKLTRLMDSWSPAKMTRFRRNYFATRDEAFEHFRSKAKFAAFDEDVLRDYVNHGTVPKDDGLELFFRPSVEAKIYNTIPHNLPRFRGRLKVPTSFIGGDDSYETRIAGPRFMRRHFPFEFRTIEGSHLFPFEKPLATAELIREIAQR